MRRIQSLTLIALGFCSSPLLFSAEISEAEVAFFETNIRPVLVGNCYECHSIESGKSKGDLLLDSRDGIRRGGSLGPAVVPNAPDESLLLAAISHADPDLEMPPRKARLADSVQNDFRRWIESGAPDPREADASVRQAPTTIEAGREFWAFRKPASSALPKTKLKNWAKRDLDHFILAELEAKGLEPSPDAEPAVILRRLHFDLVGLPPSPEVLVTFLDRVEKSGLDAALDQETQQLLESDRYGERWARHWMDVARFAESSGKESNVAFPHAWRYRDYAIDAFNEDLPYDRFVLEQLGGDLLPYDSDAERARLLIATGFLAFGAKGLNEMNRAQFAADLVDEQIDTVSRAFMAQSIACARCHDHKFDPFPMADYYALAGVFRSTETFFGTWIDSENNVGGDLITLPALEDQLIPNPSIPKTKVDQLNEQLAALQAEKKAGAKSIRDALRILWRSGGIEGQLETVDEDGNALPLCMGTLDRAEIVDAHLFERGEVDKPKEKIPRAFPRVVQVESNPPLDRQSGRIELAQWLTHPDHPSTSRVMVNRIWRHMLGRGIVRSTDNFGFNGDRPDHPELLDNFALQFIENGWSVKAMIREIALSRTYRQSSTFRQNAFLTDPENRFLWRIEKQRLEAECIRDSMLAVSGEIDFSRRPASLVAEVSKQSIALYGFDRNIPRDLDGSKRRSVYLPVIRDRLPDVLALFDFAEPSLVTGQRDTTNVPVQALYLLNSSFVLEQSKAFASRLDRAASNPNDQIKLAYQLCFSRSPEPAEFDLARTFFEKHKDRKTALALLCQALISTAEFRNLD
ncbi:MAG: hypothetical protein ACI8UO_002628 [Verrucomicrobiales bacterium]|jgi:hypothetical protein